MLVKIFAGNVSVKKFTHDVGCGVSEVASKGNRGKTYHQFESKGCG